ncbi:MAG: VCBS repeat-containing protein [Deferribacteres bacterium]|nr:VCBS repeat-containing protein [candidate division KSB1 bacterium]MCB9500714.1 VCBS repeat-containing protein [Deferribacteres bacterium]
MISITLKNKAIAGIVIFLLFSFGNPTAAFSQSARRIVSSTPAANSIIGSPSAPIVIDFDRAVELSTNYQDYVWISGNYYGYYLHKGELLARGFQIDLQNDGKRLVLTLPFETAFADGENIVVVLHPLFFNDQNDGAPVRLHFRVMTKAGIASTGFTTINLQLDSIAVQPVKAVAANLDNDEFLELAIVSATNSVISIFDNKEKELVNVFSDSILVTNALNANKLLTPLDIAAADFNHDGNMDLIVPFRDSNTAVLLWGSDGNEPKFSSENVERITNTGILPQAVKPVDFNSDGWMDLLVVARAENRVYILQNTADTVNAQSPTFTRFQKDLLTSEGPVIVTSGDFNADGFVDFATANIARRDISVFLQNIGGFGSAKVVQLPFRPVDIQALNMRITSNPSQPEFMEIAVLSSDVPYFGKTSTNEIAGTQLTLFEWDEVGETYVKYDSVQLQDQALSFDVADLNGDFRQADSSRDHLLDIALSSFRGNRIDYVFNDGGNIGEVREIKPIDSPLSILAADLNQDGIEDLIYTGYYSGELVYLRSFGLPKKVLEHDFGDTFAKTCNDLIKEFDFESPNSVTATIEWENVADTAYFKVLPLSADSVELDPASFDIFAHRPNLFYLEFCPPDTGAYETTIIIKTNLDEGEQHSQLRLKGRGTEINFLYTPTSLLFPVTPPDTSVSTIYLKIENAANDTLFLNRLWREPGLPEITQEVDFFTVLPFSRDSISFTFNPSAEGDYYDTLYVASNAPDYPLVKIPIFGRSTRNDIIYLLNPDTLLTAIEDVEFTVFLEILDPDSEEAQVQFRIEDNPGWMQLSKNKLSGQPGEGDTSATFTIITSKLHVRTEHRRTIVVQPVNDPPYFIYMPDTTIRENVPFEVYICATDDEDSTLTVGVVEEDLNSKSLFDPARDTGVKPSFTLDGRNCGLFRWTPSFGKAGKDFQVTFWVEDEDFHGDTRIEDQIYMHVYRAKPDLVLTDLKFSEPQYSLGQVATITAIFQLENAPVLASEIYSTQIAQDQFVLQTMSFQGPQGIGFIDSVTAILPLSRTGRYNFEAFVDSDSRINELDESNNKMQIELNVDVGNLKVHPNPFSPNDDGINDFVQFDLTELVRTTPYVEIFTVKGNLVTKLDYSGGNTIQWSGRDSHGRDALPGVYLYIVHNENKEIGYGYVVLAR